MAYILDTKSIYYNDVNLIAAPASRYISSRSQVPKELHRVIVSPMDAIVGPTFVKEAARLGISIMLPRFKGIEWQLEMNKLFNENNSNEKSICFCSVGLKNFEQDIELLLSNGIKSVGLDIANGYLHLGKELRFLHNKNIKFDNFYIGNIHSESGVRHLTDFSAFVNSSLFIRVGIAGGSPCATNDVVGVNRGNITEIMECKNFVENDILNSDSLKLRICADGGIKNSSYACKAFAAGADYIIMGGYFSNALEAETHISADGSYWGGASSRQLEICGIQNKHSEGKVIKVEKELVPLEKLVNDLWGGISSYVSYSGSGSLTSIIGQGVFEIKQNSLPPKDRK